MAFCLSGLLFCGLLSGGLLSGSHQCHHRPMQCVIREFGYPKVTGFLPQNYLRKLNCSRVLTAVLTLRLSNDCCVTHFHSSSILLWLQPWSLLTIMLLWHSFLIITLRECCKGDEASQWRNTKFDPPPSPNPVSDRNTNLHRWLRRGPLHLCNSSSRSAQAFRFRACVTLRTKIVLVFWVLATRYIQGPWTDFDAKHAKTCGSAQGCAISGLRT